MILKGEELISKIKAHEKSGKIAIKIVSLIYIIISLIKNPTFDQTISTVYTIMISYLIMILIYAATLMIIFLKVRKSEKEKGL